MNMIEVDPKLFITCRLCLDEMGQYQIVPKVQMQIKYCFEIDVQPFDGLPQLICKKCESILSQYAGIKQMYQVKQNSLKSVKKSAQEIPEEKIEEFQDKNTIQQQQDTVSSTQQVENVIASSSSVRKTNKQLLSLTKSIRKVTCETSIKNNECSTPTKPITKENKNKVINKPKSEKLAWASNYTKQFVCRFCSKAFTEKKSMISHIKKHEDLIMKYSSVLNSHCEIKINKVGSTLNLTNSEENVVLNKNKIINSVNSKYYILYTSKSKRESSSEASSEEELVRKVGKYKRQRLISEDSQSPSNMEKDNSQTSIDVEEHSQVSNIVECDKKADSLIDCVNIDSDSTSTKVSETDKPQQKLLCVNKKLISNIIAMCYKKYLKRFDNSKSASKQHSNTDSFLQHKVLSIGTKIIHSKGLNSIGLLRYLEHKNLDITWTQTKHSNSPIIVQPSLVNAKSSDNDINDLGWRSLNEMDPNHTTHDFVDIFEKITTHEPSPALEHREVIEESSELNSNENNIEIEKSANISPITLNEKNKIQEKNSKNSYNPIQSTDTVTETSENAVLLLRTAPEIEKQTSKKILNASPVPYPKQLPTKKSSVHESPSLLKSPTHAPVPMEAPRLEATFVNFNNDVAHMPVITSTVSLAPPAEDPKQKQSNSTISQVTTSNKNEGNLPQIKVKPISELMPDRRLQNNTSMANMAGWTVTSSNKNEGIVLHATNANLVYVANVPQYTSVANVPQYTSVTPQSAALCYPQILRSVSQENSGEAEISRQSDERTYRKNPELVHMHTVELPNNKTTSPFRYFQRLLQIHNLVLLESTVGVSHISTTMKCLIKFSLGFQQENNAPVTLCLTLYCDKNVFCIKVKDNASKDIDVSKLSANWQWEILKVFKGDIVNKLNLNALKHGLDMSCKVNHFVNLLKAIVFSKVNN